MATHEFGIMEQAPAAGKRYDEYEPELYRCIRVNDDFIEPLLAQLDCIPCFWHTLDAPHTGLAYCGITLIPPSSLDAFLAVVRLDAHLDALAALLLEAQASGRYVIHFGL